jgi:hypothetical protein
MMPIARLDLPRQIIVGNSVAGALAAERATPLSPATRARGDAVVAATRTIEIFGSYRPIQVDRAADGVIIGFDRMLENQARLLRSDVVPLGDAQRQTLADAQLVRTRLFPQGTEFIRDSMELQWSELAALRGRAQEPETAAAIDRLGLRSTADHLLAHIEMYGRIVGQHPDGPRAGEEEARATWDEAFRLFMAQVAIDYEKDTATQHELIGGYEPQLEQQRAAARAAARARRAHGGDEEQAEAPSGAEAAPAEG